MKIPSLLLALACSMQSLAAFEGFYVGGELGGVIADGKQNGESNITYANRGDVNLDLTHKLKTSSWQGALFAGYGFLWHQLYLGGEAFVQFNDCELKSHNSGGFYDGFPEVHILDSQTHLRINSVQYGVDFRPGWTITPRTLLYGRVGVGVAKLKYTTTNSFTLVDGNDQGFVSLTLHDDKTRAALRLGGGLEYQLSSNLTLRADYIYTNYGSVHVQGSEATTTNLVTSLILNSDPDSSEDGVGTLAAGNPLIIRSQSKVHNINEHALMLGLSYYLLKQTYLQAPRNTLLVSFMDCMLEEE